MYCIESNLGQGRAWLGKVAHQGVVGASVRCRLPGCRRYSDHATRGAGGQVAHDMKSQGVGVRWGKSGRGHDSGQASRGVEGQRG